MCRTISNQSTIVRCVTSCVVCTTPHHNTIIPSPLLVIAFYSRRYFTAVCCVLAFLLILSSELSTPSRQSTYPTTLPVTVLNMSKLPTEEGKKAIEANRSILSPDEQRTVDLLLDNDQAHLFAHWPPAGQQDDDKHRFLTQCALIESAYLGGIKTYVSRAKQLLAFAQQGGNPYEGQQTAAQQHTLCAAVYQVAWLTCSL